jgi:hypothetical protein
MPESAFLKTAIRGLTILARSSSAFERASRSARVLLDAGLS